MRNVAWLVVGVMLLTGMWFAMWHMLMAPDVARVKASIAHQTQQWKAANRGVELSATKVGASGFPFGFRVKVTELTASSGWGGDVSRVTVPWVLLSKTDTSQGRYRVEFPPTITARYEKQGQPAEEYRVTISPLPQLAVSAADAKVLCGPLVGKACVDVAADAPIISFAVGLPGTITLHMELNGEARDANFQMPPLTVPIFQPIPADISRSLELFVGILREALVFKTAG